MFQRILKSGAMAVLVCVAATVFAALLLMLSVWVRIPKEQAHGIGSIGVPISPNSVFLLVVTLVAIFLPSFWFFWKRN